MDFDPSLFDCDAGYYEYTPGMYLPGRMGENGDMTWTPRSVKAALDVELDDSDVLIATYPKTGQTWVMTILRHIFQSKELEEGKEASLDNFFEAIPFIEADFKSGETGADIFSKLTPPRFIKTHLLYKLWKPQLEKHPNLKVIQTIRNPKDTLVSYYHHVRNAEMMGAFNGTWDQFFVWFQKKQLAWGDFFEQNAEWYKFNSRRENSLILEYEEMKKDLRSHVVKIAKFIGYDLSDKAIDLVAEKCDFKSVAPRFKEMMENMAAWNSERGNFVRKGEVGDFKNYFSKEQSEYVDAKYEEYLKPLGIKFQYSI